MKIEHLALWTNNLESMKQFYSDYFGGVATPKYHNTKTGFESYFISFTTGARLEIMRNTNVSLSDKEVTYSGYAHIAFSVGSKEKVDNLTCRLKNDGYIVISEPRTTGDGYYESCVLDLDGNKIEITV